MIVRQTGSIPGAPRGASIDTAEQEVAREVQEVRIEEPIVLMKDIRRVAPTMTSRFCNSVVVMTEADTRN